MIFYAMVIIVVAVLYFFAQIHFDSKAYFNYVARFSPEKLNSNLSGLSDTNPLDKLPSVKFTNTGNSEVEMAQKDAMYLGPADGTSYTCHNELMVVKPVDEFYMNGNLLRPGVWCVKKLSECNLRTGYVATGLNSLVCRTKFPNMFGGDLATRIVACNNEKYPHTSSVLWDYKYDKGVDPFTVTMTDEDERLVDGRYRFACKFTKDDMNNNYIAHPLNRFHPIKNPCNKTIFSANEQIKLKYDMNGWSCDCGNKHSMVRRMIPSDPKSGCSSCSFLKVAVDLNRINFVQYPYSCLTVNSPISKVKDTVPCMPNKFIAVGNLCELIELKLHDPKKSLTGVKIVDDLLTTQADNTKNKIIF